MHHHDVAETQPLRFQNPLDLSKDALRLAARVFRVDGRRPLCRVGGCHRVGQLSADIQRVAVPDGCGNGGRRGLNPADGLRGAIGCRCQHAHGGERGSEANGDDCHAPIIA